jgi:hypothetical protein
VDDTLVPVGASPSPLRVEYAGPEIPPSMLDNEAFKLFQNRTGGRSLGFGDEAQMIRTGEGILLPAWYRGQTPGDVTQFGDMARANLLLDVPGQSRSGVIQTPQFGGRAGSVRGYPMQPRDMRLAGTGFQGGRSHIIPHHDTQIVSAGRQSSHDAAENFLAHPQRYNTRVRRTLEGRLRKGGSSWVAYNEIGAVPRLTTGGFIVPRSEYFVELLPDGAVGRVWRFPFDDLNLYNSLAGSIDDIFTRFQVPASALPLSPVRR